tara:strand:+ start:675 stop:845 length:171 start_codon:yes stop_codon:yes gene_type:complete
MVAKKGFKWDGKSRISNNTYRKNFNEIFNKEEQQNDVRRRREESSQDDRQTVKRDK